MKTRLSKRGLVRVVAAALVVLCAVLLLWFVVASQQKSVEYDTKSPEYTALQDLLDEGPPKQDAEKITYYLQLGGAYFDLKDYNQALVSVQKADSYIKDRSLETGRTVNHELATVYETLGRKREAREAYQREIDRIKDSSLAGENQEAIVDIEKKRDSL